MVRWLPTEEVRNLILEFLIRTTRGHRNLFLASAPHHPPTILLAHLSSAYLWKKTSPVPLWPYKSHSATHHSRPHTLHIFNVLLVFDFPPISSAVSTWSIYGFGTVLVYVGKSICLLRVYSIVVEGSCNFNSKVS